MVSFNFLAITLAATSVVSASPVKVDRRGLLSDIFHDVAHITGDIIHGTEAVSGDIVHGVHTAAEIAKQTFADLKCAADNFRGVSQAPHTNGIEWYEDAEYLAGVILTSGPAEWIKNQTTELIDHVIEGAEQQGAEFVEKLAGHLGLSNEVAKLANETFPIVNHYAAAVVQALAKQAVIVATNPYLALTADNFINNVVAFLEKAGIQVVESAGSIVLASSGLGVFVAPAITTTCDIGYVASNAATSFEACTLKLNLISQVLSEVRILLKAC